MWTRRDLKCVQKFWLIVRNANNMNRSETDLLYFWIVSNSYQACLWHILTSKFIFKSRPEHYKPHVYFSRKSLVQIVMSDNRNFEQKAADKNACFSETAKLADSLHISLVRVDTNLRDKQKKKRGRLIFVIRRHKRVTFMKYLL